MNIYSYPIELFQIPEDLGGGFMARIPSLGKHAFRADGDTPQEALDALVEVADTMEIYEKEQGRTLPEPPPPTWFDF